MYAVAIDFADVEILSNFRYLGGWDVVCGAPDALSGLMLLRVRCYSEGSRTTDARGLTTSPNAHGQ